jgi:hypothetical protein
VIIWSGFGFLVAVFTFAFSLAANVITNFVTGSGAYWDAHKWPLAVSLFLSAAACWLLGRFFHNRKTHILTDPQTGKQVLFRKSHTFFFIPMLYWGPILGVIGAVVAAMEFVK